MPSFIRTFGLSKITVIWFNFLHFHYFPTHCTFFVTKPYTFSLPQCIQPDILLWISVEHFQFKFNLHRRIMQMFDCMSRFVSAHYTSLAVKALASSLVKCTASKKFCKLDRSGAQKTSQSISFPVRTASQQQISFSPTTWTSTTPYKHLPLDGICVTWSMQTKWTICASQKSAVHINGGKMGQECCNWFRCDTHCHRSLLLGLQSEIPHYFGDMDRPRLIISQLIKCDLVVCLNYTSSLITRTLPPETCSLCSDSNWS